MSEQKRQFTPQRKELTDDELRHWYDWNARKRNEKGPLTAQDLHLLEMQLSLCEELFRRRSVPSERRTNAEFVGDVRKIVSDWGADDVGVERFAKAMSAKLAKKRDEGRGGWNREPYTVQPDRSDRVERLGCSIAGLRKMLREHFANGDPVDIANFCMMIWNRENPNG